MRPIALLSLWKLKNSLRTAFSDPRKLVLLIIVVGCIAGSLMLASLGTGARNPSQGPSPVALQLLGIAIPVALVLVVAAIFDYGLGDGLLALGRPDVDYLFPSPVSRRVVLLYRLPALIFGTLVQTVVFLYVFHIMTISLVPPGEVAKGVTSPAWLMPLTVLLCISTYLNIALFASIQFPFRRRLRYALLAALAAFVLTLAWIGWRQGLAGVEAFLHSPAFRVALWPVALAADTVTAVTHHRPAGGALPWLLLVYGLSLIPMFASNANWYEQSIASTERVAAMRQVAKQGGYAALMSQKAATHRHRSTKTYTVRPFGEGAVALLWAHLCAAAKRPVVNFALPLIGGIADGALGAGVNIAVPGAGIAIVAVLVFYASMGCMASAKTACEAAVRRRDLVAPLPLPGWQTVAADLGVPFLAALLFGVGAAVAYAAFGSSYWPFVAVGIGILFPLRTAARMVLQYILVLGYPDFADKLQQLLAQFAYGLFASPFLIAEIVLCLPAIFLRSFWLGVLTLTVFQAVLLAVFLALAGKASQRAIASGEPVRIVDLVRGRA